MVTYKEMYSAFAVIVNCAASPPDDSGWDVVPFFGHLSDEQRRNAVDMLLMLARDVLVQPTNTPWNRDFWKKIVEEELAEVEAIEFDPEEEEAAA